MKQDWRFPALVAVVALALGYLVAQRGLLSKAEAQVTGARAGSVTCLMGEATRTYYPIILVDALEETILVYEFKTLSDLRLSAARTYRYDKQIPEYNNTGMSVDEVKTRIERR